MAQLFLERPFLAQWSPSQIPALLIEPSLQDFGVDWLGHKNR